MSSKIRPRAVEAEHARLAQAALDRDADAAVRALSEHLAVTAEIIVESRWGFDE